GRRERNQQKRVTEELHRGEGATDPGELDLAQRVASVDEEPAVGLQRPRDSLVGPGLELGVATIQRADTNGQGEIESCLAGRELEILDRDLAVADGSGADPVGRSPARLVDRPCRTVDP